MSRTTRQNVPSDFATGGAGLTPDGSGVPAPVPSAFGLATPPANPDLVSILWSLLGRVGPAVAGYAALAAFGATNTPDRQDGMMVQVQADGSVWTWNAGSTKAAAGGSVVVTTDAPATGRFELVASKGSTQPPIAHIDLKGAVLAAGTPMAAWADNAASAPGAALSDSKAVGVRWNDAASQVAVWSAVDLPLDLDPAYPVTFVVLATKEVTATVTDLTTFTITAFAQTAGALEDAGSDLGGTTTAFTAAQAVIVKGVTRLTLTSYLPPTPPARLSVSLKPTNGTLSTDDISCSGFWIEYVRKSGPARVVIDMRAAVLAAGTPMAAFANNASSNPGVTLDNSKAVGNRWNNNATQTAIWGSFVLPGDLDVTKPSVVVVLASKSGATGGDATTFDVALYEQVAGALEDAGSNLGGTTSALVDTATAKTVSKLTLGLPANTFTAGPHGVSVSLKPTNGTLGTDDAVLNGLWLEYTRKAASPIFTFDLKAAVLAAGTPMAAFANNAGASAPGVTLNNSKAVGLRWNNFATQTAVWTERDCPLDFDPNQPCTLNFLVSKSGATAADLTSLTVALWEQAAGALDDAGPSFAGTTSALTAAQAALAAKTVTKLSATIPAGTLSAAPSRLSLSLKPTDGSNLTDDVLVCACWIEYGPKLS